MTSQYPKDWKVLPFGKCGDWYSGGTPDTNNPEYWHGDIPWITSSSLHTFYLSESERRVTTLGVQNGTRLMPAGTILFIVRGMSLKKEFRVGIAQKPVAFGQDCKAVIAKDGIDPYFLAVALESKTQEILGLVDEASHGTGRLQTPLLQKVEIPIPPLPEQRKIAAILGTWDAASGRVEQLIAALQRRKQGLMQRLLTGAVRFPEFAGTETRQQTRYTSLPAEWDYVAIGEIAREVSLRNTDGDNLSVLSCTKYDGLVDSLSYFGRQIFSEDTSSYKVVKRRQFAYATNHIEEGSIGYQDLYDAALISPMYTVFETTDRVNDAFLYRLLKTELYRHIFEVNTSGTVNRRGRLGWDDFARIRVPLPSEAEQRKIAEFFAVVDQEIALQQKRLAQLQAQKKGLMQRLLTGQVRVKVDSVTPAA